MLFAVYVFPSRQEDTEKANTYKIMPEVACNQP